MQPELFLNPAELRSLTGFSVRLKQIQQLRKMGIAFRDLRAKAGTDKADSHGMREAQMQLGHKNMTMTEHYVRGRLGQKVSPTK